MITPTRSTTSATRCGFAGRAAEAIPILKQRVKIPNQVETVKAELKQAKKDAKAQESGA